MPLPTCPKELAVYLFSFVIDYLDVLGLYQTKQNGLLTARAVSPRVTSIR